MADLGRVSPTAPVPPTHPAGREDGDGRQRRGRRSGRGSQRRTERAREERPDAGTDTGGPIIDEFA